MELKTYQRKAISNLTRYLELMNETKNIGEAFSRLWEEQTVPVGVNGLRPYRGAPRNFCVNDKKRPYKFLRLSQEWK